MTVRIEHSDSRDILPTLEECSVDSCVTDPPYSLVSIQKRFGKPGSTPAQEGRDGLYRRASAGFMGQTWDTGETAHDPAFWAEVLRVLKPGAHLVAFGGTRTYHRMVCAIEDAGFEIRDQLAWITGQGFPKSLDVGKKLNAAKERCTCPTYLRSVRCDVDAEDALSGSSEQDVRTGLRGSIAEPDNEDQTEARRDARNGELLRLRQTVSARTGSPEAREESDVLIEMQRGHSWSGMGRARLQGIASTDAGILRQGRDEGVEEPGMEGRCDVSEPPRQLRERPLCEVPASPDEHGAPGRLRDGASSCDGSLDWATADASGNSASRGPRSAQQSAVEPGTLAEQSEPQTGGTWPHCRRCGKPIIPDGLGTALKPAFEPICLARKPLSEPTVAANVLRWGTGALNIDGCRVESESIRTTRNTALGRMNDDGWNPKSAVFENHPAGRWPANLCHDGSDEVLAAFPSAPGQQRSVGPHHGAKPSINTYGDFGPRKQFNPRGDEGSAARFFYAAKADAEDRWGSKHPTVKPVALMRWLVRLVTPPRGLVLDPFAGSGTTGAACLLESRSVILIEREARFIADINRRIDGMKAADMLIRAECAV